MIHPTTGLSGAQSLFPVIYLVHCHGYPLPQSHAGTCHYPISTLNVLLLQHHFLLCCSLTLETPLHNSLAQKYLQFTDSTHLSTWTLIIAWHTVSVNMMPFYWVFILTWRNSNPGNPTLHLPPAYNQTAEHSWRKNYTPMLTKFKLNVWSRTSKFLCIAGNCIFFLVNLFTHSLRLLFCIFSFLLEHPLPSHCSQWSQYFLIKREFPHFPITFPSTTFWVCAYLIHLFSVTMDELTLLIPTATLLLPCIHMHPSCLFKVFDSIIVPSLLYTIKIFLLNS